MLKKLVIALVLVLGTGVVLQQQPVSAQIVTTNKVEICHRDTNVKKPWGPSRIDVDKSSVNGGGMNDHSQHTGGVPTSEAEAQAMKTAKQDWGDIIPPFDNYPGLNWTAEGIAIYNNNCQFVTPRSQPDLTYLVDCVTVNSQAKVKVVITNSGSASGNATVNGQNVTVAANSSETVYFDTKATVVITLNGTHVYNKLVDCTPGRGSGSSNTVTPSDLPQTSGVNYTTTIIGAAGAIVGLTALIKVLYIKFF